MKEKKEVEPRTCDAQNGQLNLPVIRQSPSFITYEAFVGVRAISPRAEHKGLGLQAVPYYDGLGHAQSSAIEKLSKCK